MLHRIAALAFIFLCTSVAWLILGATIINRTETQGPSLRSRVSSTWGGPQEQRSPKASALIPATRKVNREVNGKVVELTDSYVEHVPLRLTASTVDVGLKLDHRQKGLLWYSTYEATFAADYKFHNQLDKDCDVTIELKYPAKDAVYDGLQFIVDGAAVPVEQANGAASATIRMKAGAAASLRTGYRTQGLDNWRYRFDEGVSQVSNFQLKMKTNFRDIDFPDNSLSPASKSETADGWDLEWKYANLVSGFPISLRMPGKLQPGPLAGSISLFAPVSLFFFFFVIFLISTLRGIDIHPMNYFFLAAAFFAFHLLLAYLVDHISIHLAFVISSAVSLFLVVSYLRIVVSEQFAWREASLAQLLYLILFSYAFFFKGYTGLAVTIGSIVTLFVAMQATARVKWGELFRGGARPRQES